jgi:hypothetical protein
MDNTHAKQFYFLAMQFNDTITEHNSAGVNAKYDIAFFCHAMVISFEIIS